MYRPGKIFYAGGGDPPTNTAEVINSIQLHAMDRYLLMANARRQLNLTMLPDGRVLAMGGTSAPGFTNPAGGAHDGGLGSRQGIGPPGQQRGHPCLPSTTVLLPDGRLVFAEAAMAPVCPMSRAPRSSSHPICSRDRGQRSRPLRPNGSTARGQAHSRTRRTSPRSASCVSTRPLTLRHESAVYPAQLHETVGCHHDDDPDVED
jgi:hypothetical protein